MSRSSPACCQRSTACGTTSATTSMEGSSGRWLACSAPTAIAPALRCRRMCFDPRPVSARASTHTTTAFLSLQVPLIIKLPHSARHGSVIERPVPLVDLFPTILQLVGIEKSARSLLADASPKAIYSETLYPRIHIGWSELRSLIDERFHYIDG